MPKLRPRFPIYIPSYSRWQWERALTARALDRMGLKYKIIVEPFQADKYIDVFGKKYILILPEEYHRNYETLDDYGMSKPQGPGPARNFAWEHSIKRGYDWHWVMDDNIRNFLIRHKGARYPTDDPAFFRLMEDFVLQYENISMAGPHYFMFSSTTIHRPPLTFNTRIYSCNLIRNDVPFRWRGRYNEDTILSLDMLFAGWVTVQFNVFLQEKVNTQKIKGGNAEAFYLKEGTYPKSLMLYREFPEVVRLTYRFRRWHHYVDYSIFKQRPIRKKDARPPERTPYKFRLRSVKSKLPTEVER